MIQMYMLNPFILCCTLIIFTSVAKGKKSNFQLQLPNFYDILCLSLKHIE